MRIFAVFGIETRRTLEIEGVGPVLSLLPAGQGGLVRQAMILRVMLDGGLVVLSRPLVTQPGIEPAEAAEGFEAGRGPADTT